MYVPDILQCEADITCFLDYCVHRPWNGTWNIVDAKCVSVK